MPRIHTLWSRKKFSAYDSAFEASFDREIMTSELKRAVTVSIIASFIAAWFIAIPAYLGDRMPVVGLNRVLGMTLYSWYSLVFMALAGYELIFTGAIYLFLRKDMMFPILPRYFNALIEISMPSVIIFSTYTHHQSIQALYTPTILLYCVFISLGALRLMFSLPAFAGIAAGAQYIALSLYFLRNHPADPGSPILYSPVIHITKGLLLAAVGVITGLVSMQIRKRLTRAIHAMEDRNRIVGIFGQHVSPAVVNRLLEQNGELGSETRHVCMMFLDIRDFTRFASSRKPEEVVDYLNLLFQFMIDIVNGHRGIINKFLGDGFMAVFGAPLSDGHDCLHAAGAALRIVERLDCEIRAGRIPSTRIGIGLHAGEAVTGHVGSPLRKEYTIIGDVVNLASRIEQLNKTHGSRVLISGAVREALGDSGFRVEDLGEADIRGHAGAVRIYRLA